MLRVVLLPPRGAGQFQGSKRKGRTQRADDKEVHLERRKLRKVRALSQRLGSRYELDAYVRGIENPDMRAAVVKLLLAFRPDLRKESEK